VNGTVLLPDAKEQRLFRSSAEAEACSIWIKDAPGCTLWQTAYAYAYQVRQGHPLLVGPEGDGQLGVVGAIGHCHVGCTPPHTTGRQGGREQAGSSAC